jgi:GNAT superfamily N-acetyltransferase
LFDSYVYNGGLGLLNEMVFILELDGRPKGSIGITRLRDDAAQLRWFLLEKEARGRGWGRKFIEEVSALELPFENGKHICVLGIK